MKMSLVLTGIGIVLIASVVGAPVGIAFLLLAVLVGTFEKKEE